MQLKYGSIFKDSKGLLNLYKKINEKNVKNRKIKINIFDILNEKSGKRYHKYNENFRKKIDWRYKKIPISHEISGIENINQIEEDDVTPYCYNKNGVCPFWRKNYSLDIIYCDEQKGLSEIDNIENGDLKGLTFYKKYEILNKHEVTMHLFDMVNICYWK